MKNNWTKKKLNLRTKIIDLLEKIKKYQHIRVNNFSRLDNSSDERRGTTSSSTSLNANSGGSNNPNFYPKIILKFNNKISNEFDENSIERYEQLDQVEEKIRELDQIEKNFNFFVNTDRIYNAFLEIDLQYDKKNLPYVEEGIRVADLLNKATKNETTNIDENISNVIELKKRWEVAREKTIKLKKENLEICTKLKEIRETTPKNLLTDDEMNEIEEEIKEVKKDKIIEICNEITERFKKDIKELSEKIQELISTVIEMKNKEEETYKEYSNKREKIIKDVNEKIRNDFVPLLTRVESDLKKKKNNNIFSIFSHEEIQNILEEMDKCQKELDELKSHKEQLDEKKSNLGKKNN